MEFPVLVVRRMPPVLTVTVELMFELVSENTPPLTVTFDTNADAPLSASVPEFTVVVPV